MSVIALFTYKDPRDFKDALAAVPVPPGMVMTNVLAQIRVTGQPGNQTFTGQVTFDVPRS